MTKRSDPLIRSETYVVCELKKQYVRGIGRIARFLPFPTRVKWGRTGNYISNPRPNPNELAYSLTDNLEAACLFRSIDEAVSCCKHKHFKFQILPFSSFDSATTTSKEIEEMIANPKPEKKSIKAQNLRERQNRYREWKQEERIRQEAKEAVRRRKESEQAQIDEIKRAAALMEATELAARLKAHYQNTYVVIYGSYRIHDVLNWDYLLTPWSTSAEWTKDLGKAFKFDSGDEANFKAREILFDRNQQSTTPYIVLPTIHVAEERVLKLKPK